MTDLILQRIEADDHATLGELMLDGQRLCYTLENRPPKQAGVKEPGLSRIPAGRRRLSLHTGGRFFDLYTGRWSWHHAMVEIELPGWDAVLFHCGNTHADTAGCVLVGASYGDTAAGLTVFSSRQAYAQIYSDLHARAGAGRFLTIRDEP